MKSLVCALLLGAAVGMVSCSTHDKSTVAAPVKYENNLFYYQRSSLFDSLPIRSSDIIMLGNSITNGCEWHELFDNPHVKNRGISSDVIQGIYERLDPIICGKPEKIFLMIGINDISHNLGPDSIVDAYLHLISHIRTRIPQTQLFVQSILPVRIEALYKGMKGKEPQIPIINQRVSAAADSLGFTWINLYDEFADADGRLNPEYTNDGLHLLASGYLKWRDCLLPYIQALAPSPAVRPE